MQASVHIQAKAEQEEEFISNTLLKKIQALKKEKENLALNYEQEEECLTNDLSRKLDQVRLALDKRLIWYKLRADSESFWKSISDEPIRFGYEAIFRTKKLT